MGLSYRNISRCRHGFRYLMREFHSVPRKCAWRVCFFGNDDFAVSSLQKLNESRLADDNGRTVSDLHIISSVKNSPVERYCVKNSLDVGGWPPNVDLHQYDVGVVVSFGHLIPSRIINKFKYGVLNVHPSLLPRWRGASPITHTILYGDKVTGVTITEILPTRFDIGNILLQEHVPVPENCCSRQLSHLLSHIGANLLLTTLGSLEEIKNSAKPQEIIGASYASKLKSSTAFINWKKSTVIEIQRQHRALSHMFDLRSYYKGKLIRFTDCQISEAALLNKAVDDICGRPWYCKKSDVLYVKCKDGMVGFKGVVYKSLMSAKSFYNGYLSKDENSNEIFESEIR